MLNVCHLTDGSSSSKKGKGPESVLYYCYYDVFTVL